MEDADGQELRFVNSELVGWSQREPAAVAQPTAGLSGSGAPAGPAASPALSAPAAPQASSTSDEGSRRQIYSQLKVAAQRAQLEGQAPQEERALSQVYLGQVADKFHLTPQEQKDILAEGDAKRWPMPPIVFGPPLGGTPPTPGYTYTTGMALQLLAGPIGAAPGTDVRDVMTLPAGSSVRVLQPARASTAGWCYVQVLTGIGAPSGGGWVYGLTVMPNAALPGRAGQAAARGARGPARGGP